MEFIKKKSLNASEVAQIRRCCSNYVWAVLDIDKNSIVIGDKYLLDMRDALIYKFRSRAKDIYGVGIDLRTGEIYYAQVVNRMNKIYREYKSISNRTKERIETMVAYYFERFEPFRSKPQHTHHA